MSKKKYRMVEFSTQEKIERWINFLTLTGIQILIPFPIYNSKSVLGLIFIGLIYLLFLIQYIKAPLFKVINTDLNFDELEVIAKTCQLKLDWEDCITLDNKIISYKPIDWQWHGLKITILKNNGLIYFNSMVNPSIVSNPFSFGWNNKNYKVFKDKVEEFKSGVDILNNELKKLKTEENKFWMESEWSIKNQLKRIGMYLLVLIFTIISFFILSEGFNIVPIVVLGLCIYYIYIDVKIIREKAKRRKVKNKKP